MSREDRILEEIAEVLGDEAAARGLYRQLGAAAPAESPPHGALARMRRKLRVPGWVMPGVVLLAVGVAGGPAVAQFGLGAVRHGVWLALFVLSVVLARLGTERPREALALAALGALVPALGTPMVGGMDLWGCARMQVATGLLPLAVGGLAAWRSPVVTGWHLAAFAACGASAGNAALAVLCGGHPSHLEGVLSHALGVWASGLLGAVAATPLWLRDRRASL